MSVPYRRREMVRDNDLTWLVIVTDTDPETNTVTRRNLTNHDLFLTAKHDVTDLDVDAVTVLTSEPDGGITILAQDGATLGEARVIFPGADTTDFPDTTTWVYYDLDMLTATGERVTLERGEICVIPGIRKTIP